jgi:hypothetical protein
VEAQGAPSLPTMAPGLLAEVRARQARMLPSCLGDGAIPTPKMPATRLGA